MILSERKGLGKERAMELLKRDEDEEYEYGRVVRAEMEALLMFARNNISCRGATLYATTFQCHNSAKHIIATGILKVTYIEPYPKNKALEFYKNEISDKECKDKVQFVGVGPHF